MVSYAERQRRMVMTRGRQAAWERRDREATKTIYRQQCLYFASPQQKRGRWSTVMAGVVVAVQGLPSN